MAQPLDSAALGLRPGGVGAGYMLLTVLYAPPAYLRKPNGQNWPQLGRNWRKYCLKRACSSSLSPYRISTGYWFLMPVTHEVAGSSPVVPAISLADRSRPDRLPVVNPAEV